MIDRRLESHIQAMVAFAGVSTAHIHAPRLTVQACYARTTPAD